MARRPSVMRGINTEDLPWEELVMSFAENALQLFKTYGDLYQISGTYRTLASCCNEQGRYEEALSYLSEALGYVNRHHEKFYPLPSNFNGLMMMVSKRFPNGLPAFVNNLV